MPLTKLEMEMLVQKQVEAYNARDIDAFCACFHDDVATYMLDSGAAIVSGIVQFREKYRLQFETSPNLHCEIRSRIVLGRTVVDEEWVIGNAAAPEGIHCTATYAFRNGLIDKVWFAL